MKASRRFGELQREGGVTVYAGAMVVKHADGTVTVKQIERGRAGRHADRDGRRRPDRAAGWTGGAGHRRPSGLTFGAFYDIDTARVGEDFVDDVSKSLTPNKVALVAEVDEEWTTPVDTRMEALGGVVFRRALWEVREKIHDEDVAAMKADLAQMKSEISKANAERKAKLQKKIDQLDAKIDAQEKKAKERREAFHARQKAKLEILKKNAAAAGRALKELAQTPV